MSLKVNDREEKVLIENYRKKKFDQYSEKICKKFVDKSENIFDDKISNNYSKWVNSIFEGSGKGLKKIVLLPNWKEHTLDKNYVSYLSGKTKFKRKYVMKSNAVVTSLYKVLDTYSEVIKKSNKKNIERLKITLQKYNSKEGICMKTYGKSVKSYLNLAGNSKVKMEGWGSQKSIQLNNYMKMEMERGSYDDVSTSWKTYKDPMKERAKKMENNVLQNCKDIKRWWPKLSKDGSIDILKVKRSKVDNGSPYDTYICVKSTAPDYNLDMMSLYEEMEKKQMTLSKLKKMRAQDDLIEASIRNNKRLAFCVSLALDLNITLSTEDTKSFVKHSSMENKMLVAYPDSIQVSNYFVRVPDVKLKKYLKYTESLNQSVWAHNFPETKSSKKMDYSVYAYMRNSVLNDDYSHKAPTDLKYKNYVEKAPQTRDQLYHSHNVKGGGDYSFDCESKKNYTRQVKILVSIPSGYVMLKKGYPIRKCDKNKNCKFCKPGFMAIPTDYNDMNKGDNKCRNKEQNADKNQQKLNLFEFEPQNRFNYYLVKLSDKKSYKKLPTSLYDKRKIKTAFSKLNLNSPHKNCITLIKITQ